MHRYYRCISLRSLAARVGMRTVGEKHLQPACANPGSLDASALRFQAVPLSKIDRTLPLRDPVVIKVGETDASLGNQALDQLQCLRPSSARLAAHCGASGCVSSGHFALRSVRHERRRVRLTLSER